MILPMLAAAVAQPMPSRPDLGTAEASCRAPEPGPAIAVSVRGLKDRAGVLRAELYPDNDQDFLADDNILLTQGKVFRRVDAPLPPSGPVALCIRVPAAGRYALALLHDRNSDRKFSFTRDGVGFPGNPKLGWSRPSAAVATVIVGKGVTATTIVLNYRRGLMSIGPIDQ